MKRNRPPSKSTRLVLAQLSLQPSYGYNLMKTTGLKSGTLYPILMRLKDRGLLSAQWEAPEIAGRPTRQSYKFTAKGQAYAKEMLSPEEALSNLKPVNIS